MEFECLIKFAEGRNIEDYKNKIDGIQLNDETRTLLIIGQILMLEELQKLRLLKSIPDKPLGKYHYQGYGDRKKIIDEIINALTYSPMPMCTKDIIEKIREKINLDSYPVTSDITYIRTIMNNELLRKKPRWNRAGRGFYTTSKNHLRLETAA